jgi:hypothetical protein
MRCKRGYAFLPYENICAAIRTAYSGLSVGTTNGAQQFSIDQTLILDAEFQFNGYSKFTNAAKDSKVAITGAQVKVNRYTKYAEGLYRQIG